MTDIFASGRNVFFDGAIGYCLKGKYKGKRVEVLRWVHDDIYVCEVMQPDLKEIVLRSNEIETVYQHDKRLGLI